MGSEGVSAESFARRDIISIRDFSRPELDYLLEVAATYEGRRDDSLKGKVLGTLFFEPSTRTRLSFESAITMLGGKYIGFSQPGGTSLAKGESLADTIRVVEGYADVLVMRHPLEGAARLAAEVASVPVINGGDGANQHPTQTFLDLYTIQRATGQLAGISVAFVGDMRYGRTVHSLAEALALYDGTRMAFVAPRSLRMPPDLLASLQAQGADCREVETLEDVGPVDIMYVTRIQRERFPDPVEYERVKNVFRIDRRSREHCGESVRIMHPLPRVDEIATEVDELPEALYFHQAHLGVTVRKALLALVLGAV